MTRPTGEDAMSSEHVEVLWAMLRKCVNERLARKSADREAAALAAAIEALKSAPQPPAEAQPDREADRKRFPDKDFNLWLDTPISDCGHTVWHTIGDVASAWAAWDVQSCAPPPSAPEAQPVGEAGTLPGSNGGFTTAVFKASDVPVGTKLYAHPPPSAPVGVERIAAEIRASLGHGATVSTRRRWAIELEALAQQPAPVAPVGVEALVGNWKARAETKRAESKNKDWAEWLRENHAGAASAFTTCARELSAALAQQPAAVDEASPYPDPRNRREAAALAKLALAYLGATSAHIDAAVARCETDLAAQPGVSNNDR